MKQSKTATITVKQNKNYCVYGLFCPHSLELKYIGATKFINDRYNTHRSLRKNPSTPIEKWIKEIKINGYSPLVMVLFESDSPIEINVKEREYIKKFRDKILNGTKAISTYSHGVPIDQLTKLTPYST